MKVMTLFVMPGFVLLNACGQVFGYELGTHARITYNALTRSVTYSDPTRVADFGLPSGWATPLGGEYNDATSIAVAVRSAQPYDSSLLKMPQPDANDIKVSVYRTWPHGWLMSGAVREDDSGRVTNFVSAHTVSAEREPHDDPWGDFNRFCSHFFDPVRNREFTSFCAALWGPFAAPVWALGQVGPFAIPFDSAADAEGRNHFTVRQARDEMWTAVTGLAKDGSPKATDAHKRLRSWATVFRALGDVLHLNQDMAQPQHTRDEGHGSREYAWYEKYIEARAKGQTRAVYSFPFRTLTADNLAPLGYGNYPIPALDRYGDFWSTGLGEASAAGVGLADYSNRGFFTPDNNLGDSKYARPTGVRSAYVDTPVTRDGRVDLYLDATVHDSLLNTDSRPIHMTRSSLLDDSLRQIASEFTPPLSAPEIFSVDRDVFDDRAELLIPRAVAYSAGLIDYFFRGRMSIAAPDDGVYALVDHAIEKDAATGGFARIKAKIANTTPNERMTTGKLVGVLRFHRDICYVDDLSGVPTTSQMASSCRAPEEEITVSDVIDLPAGLLTIPADYTFEFATKLPINATDVRFQVAYRGTLGNEDDAVVIATRDLSEPSYFTYHNATDYARIGDHVYSRAEINADSSLLAQVSPPSCVDRSQSPPQLASSCLQPLSINLVLGIGATPKTVAIRGLPVRRFARFAFLADDGDVTFAQLAYSCLPADPFTFATVTWQVDADPYTGVQLGYWSRFLPLRGLMGWQQTSCVLSGDGVLSGTPDDRSARLDAVTEHDPVAVEISP